jgi:CDP-diacylglycerol--glycerol-3-phosphate 3-phosphatidyltransferase
MAFLLSNLRYGNWLAAIVFALAAGGDGLDGYLARKQSQETLFGRLADPVADKLLVSAALVSLVDLNQLSSWVAMVIISREFAVSGLRLIAIANGSDVRSSYIGKFKTALQVLAILVWILKLNPNIAYNFKLITPVAIILMALAVIVTVISGFDYFLRFRSVFEGSL